MGKKKNLPREARKQRTRKHVIADLSVNHVERLILENGFTSTPSTHDYGFDITIETFDTDGYYEEGRILLQLKATDDIETKELKREEAFAYAVDYRDILLWTEEFYPVFLILFDARRREAYWLDVQRYFADHPPTRRTQTIKVHFPKHNVLGSRTILFMQQHKNQILKNKK